MSDLQDLILFIASRQPEDCKEPKWCSISREENLKKIVVVLVSGVGAAEYNENQESFSQCSKLFKRVRDVILLFVPES